ncbi:glycerate kinase [Rhodobacteraceae bacterium NNCM2]|nr:glycerate kinase [Coraliihabitans acroporae]
MTDPADFLRRLFDTAVAAADPMIAVPAHLPAPPKGRVVVIGAGKASARMAEALESVWQGPISGLVITRYGYARPCKHIKIIEASHPVPDQAGAQGAARMLETVAGLSPDDLVIALISGGGSALMPLPAGEITLAEKQEVNRALLACGANIGEMNTVRKHLSAIKGGRLAAACHPAKLVSLMISDVPGDDPGVIASGPTVGEASTSADAQAIIERYGIKLPDSAARHLQSTSGCPAPDDPRLAHAENIIISAPQISLEAAAAEARKHGITPVILGDSIEGEAREVGIVMAGIAQQVLTHSQPLPRPCVLLSGGETTVTLRGNGRGGRNVEFLLSAAIKLEGRPVWALAGDTDGVDGAEEIAGAIATPDTLVRARAAGIDPHAELANNNGHGFFEALGDQVITGPTLTNVNDFRAFYIP